jgi:multidrug efflux pump subunit AcrA (membrane-fusion protein)
MLRESAERERLERDRLRVEREQARSAARASAAHAAALDAARLELEQAIVKAREARRTGSGVAATDAAWRRAKARLIELETGVPPEWARDVASNVHEVSSEDDDPS